MFKGESGDRGSGRETERFCVCLQLKSSRDVNAENSGNGKATDGEDVEPSSDTYLNKSIKVQNSVVDNELGGRGVTALPSWKKNWDGLKTGSLTPSVWLQTDGVTLNTVRWGGTFLCGMGQNWSVEE